MLFYKIYRGEVVRDYLAECKREFQRECLELYHGDGGILTQATKVGCKLNQEFISHSDQIHAGELRNAQVCLRLNFMQLVAFKMLYCTYNFWLSMSKAQTTAFNVEFVLMVRTCVGPYIGAGDQLSRSLILHAVTVTMYAYCPVQFCLQVCQQ